MNVAVAVVAVVAVAVLIIAGGCFWVCVVVALVTV